MRRPHQIALPLALIASIGMTAELFVSPKGNDASEGTRTAPFETLERARDAIRAMKAGPGLPEGGVTVTILPGTYARAATFALGTEDSGAPGRPIVYRAQPGTVARFSGGRELGGFEPVAAPEILARLPEQARPHIVQTDLRAQGIEDFGTLTPRGMGLPVRPAALELFVNGSPMPLARWPNEGFVRTGKVLGTGSRVFSRGGAQGFISPHKAEEPRPGRFVFDNPRLERWTAAADIWVHGYWGRDWSEEHLPVARIDPVAKEVHMGQPTRYGHYPDKRFYFLNLLEEIDRPGEWYLDRRTGILYLWPPATLTPVRASVSVLDQPLVVMRGVSHVVLRRLVLEQTRTNAIDIHDGADVLVEACTLRNIGNQAVRVLGGTGHAVLGCDIMDAGDGGILLRGGDRRKLLPAGHRAENNHVFRYARWCRTYRPAISLQGVGNVARHNLLHDSAHMAVTLGGNDHIFELNEIHSVVRETTDSSALYAGGNPTTRGNVIRHNYWHHIGSGLSHSGQSAVYLDDGLSGTRITGNLFYRVGGKGNFGATMVHGGKDNLFGGNAFVECHLGLLFSTWSAETWGKFLASPAIRRAFEQVDADGPLYRTRYPALADIAANPGANTMRHNLWYRCNRPFRERPEGRVANEAGFVTDTNPGFRQPEEADFRMRAPVPELKALGFEPIPFAEIGLRPGPERASWPVENAVLPMPESE